MRKIDLQRLIKDRCLDKETLARHLFPTNKYPVLAINRVLKGKSDLNESQISKLALFSGMTIEELYSESGWKKRSEEGKHIFLNGDYRAELDTKTWVTKIFHKDSMFHESIIHSGSIPLSEYIEKLNNQIHQNESN